MEKVYLCGHTGSINRGCEAILRSTAYILNECEITDVTAMTFDKTYDEKLNLDQFIKLISYPKKKIFIKIVGYLKRRILNDGIWGSKIFYYDMFKSIKNDTVVFNVGGDTYCYGEPYISYALNELADDNNIPNVFWGCSVDERALNSKKMQEDINKYSYIVVRESLSYNILKQIVKDHKKIIKACDPAFQLPIKKIELPKYFKENNTVGINLSPLVFSDFNNDNDIMYQNIHCLIEYILKKTDMNICLIPHVYNIENHSQDIDILSRIYDKYSKTSRVGIVSDELSCTELKYIISQCRFFIGARTHATIAAYSTAVPTIALSYSIKSRGIAKDLFGTEEKFAIPWKNIKEREELKDAFIDVLINQEDILRNRYTEILPKYKQSIIEAVNTLKELV